MYRTYTLLFRLGLVVAFPYYLVRFRKYLPTLSDRFGFLKIPHLQNSIWIHAVSVGEVKAVERLIEKIRKQFPSHPIVVSTITPTGQQLARERRDIIDRTFYFPLDMPGAVGRALDRIQPKLVIIAETEIWPNFLNACRGRAIPVMMINGRISDSSFPRYQRIRRWLRRVLKNYTVLGMQSDVDRARIEAIGADPERVTVFGNIKYDVVPSGRELDESLAGWLRTPDPLWIAASTMPGEEELVLDTFRRLRKGIPNLRLMIAPRHPDRSELVVDMSRSGGLAAIRRSNLPGNADILVLDTIGELAAAFEFAAVVFVGGSLVSRGGHNVLEPARYSKPIIFGPHMENFRDIARLFLDAGAAIQVQGAGELEPVIHRVLADTSLAESLGNRAKRVLDDNAGATDRIVAFIRERVLVDPEAVGVRQ